MRRIDVIGIGIGIALIGGGLYVGLRIAGVDSLSAGVWSQVLFLTGVIGWVSTYLFRVVTSNMTYSQQLKDYEEAVLQKRLEEMSPEELAALEAQVAAAKAAEKEMDASETPSIE